MESRIDLFKYELNTKNLSPEDVKALVYSFFKNNSNSNKLDAKIKIPDVQEFINRRLLHYLCDALDDIIKAQSDSSSKPEQKESVMEITSKTKIFVVHGRDQVKYELESLLRTWGLEPIILDEQIGGSKTIIEKFEEHSSKAQCAIVLLTPDDEGHLKGDKDLNPRARQNVIFELGYFFAKLGRDRVICIYKNGVEIPSDIKGMNPITFDNSLKKDVYMMLSKELRAMGLSLND